MIVWNSRLKTLLKTNDAVILSVVQSILKECDIDFLLLDQNMSILEGSIGIIPRRIMVGDESLANARKLIKDTGIGHELESDQDN